jgi:hypothetical protein
MAQFRIEFGVGGGYNDIITEVIEANSLDEAVEAAYLSAIEVFESYGIFEDQNDVEEFDNDDDYQAAYDEEVERWCSYSAEPI